MGTSAVKPAMIGLLGGTFDPIHYGHLRAALEVYQALNLTCVYFIPLAHAVHRSPPVASAIQRLSLLRIALANSPEFQIDERELQRATPSYTFTTLTELRHEQPDTIFCWLLGRDAFNHFLNWYRPYDILDLAHLVVMDRPGVEWAQNPALTQLLTERRCEDVCCLRNRLHGHIYMQPVTPLGISATAIRADIAAGRNPRFLLPDATLAHIYHEHLYY